MFSTMIAWLNKIYPDVKFEKGLPTPIPSYPIESRSYKILFSLKNISRKQNKRETQILLSYLGSIVF